MRQLGDNIALAQHQQAHQANKHGRKNTSTFCVGLVYLHKSAAPPTVLHNPKLQVPWIGPFPIKEVISPTSMKLDLPDDWRIHPTFYVGKIKRHLPRFIDGEAAPSDGEQCPAGHLHQALDSCQSFKHDIVLQSHHAMPLHLPLNRRQASDDGVMLRRARLKNNQTPQHVVGDVSVCICRTTSSW
ncbi:hypothetical protein B5M09_012978 [Aphanomyces astaci]|uniref:Tf2-1-like SH3-like domain-containing protein n=1 Tax=Aphanomyces astaci TaxID=112090 RepID=A0A3R7WSA0_APHAT|nr:hypothetical protein B5M09_012978 [Aphanomyces astaci]